MCQQQVVAEDIEYFCRLAKENWSRPLLTGVFYGYIHMTFCRQASGGHLAVEQILNSPYVDYLSGPASYWSASREVGGSGNPRSVIESILLHGKLWLDEMDNGFMQKNTGFDNIRVTTEPDPEYLSLLERNTILPLMRGTGLWYYDFGLQKSFGWWDRPLYLEKISKIKSFFDKRLAEQQYPEADILYVWDMESFYFVANKFTPVCYDQIDQAFEETARSGTVGDHIFLFDLPKVDLDKYKAVVFMNTYKITNEERDFILNKVAKNGRTLIWNYLPGFTDGKKLDIGFVKKVTGFNITLTKKLNTPVVQLKNSPDNYTFSGPVAPLAVITDDQAQPLGFLKGTDSVVTAKKTFRDHTEIYSTLPLHLPDQFRNLFRAAGCHIYNDSNDFTYEHSGLLLLHTKEGGKRLLHLRNGKDISMEFPPHSTTLLDGETGKVLLE
jgi:hypothetical protein